MFFSSPLMGSAMDVPLNMMTDTTALDLGITTQGEKQTTGQPNSNTSDLSLEEKDAINKDEVPEDIRAFFGHPLTAASTAIEGDDTHASALALLHEYQNLPALDRTDLKAADKYDALSDILRDPMEFLTGIQREANELLEESEKDEELRCELKKDPVPVVTSAEYMVMLNTDVDAFFSRHSEELASADQLGMEQMGADADKMGVSTQSQRDSVEEFLLQAERGTAGSSPGDVNDFSEFAPTEQQPLDLALGHQMLTNERTTSQQQVTVNSPAELKRSHSAPTTIDSLSLSFPPITHEDALNLSQMNRTKASPQLRNNTLTTTAVASALTPTATGTTTTAASVAAAAVVATTRKDIFPILEAQIRSQPISAPLTTLNHMFSGQIAPPNTVVTPAMSVSLPALLSSASKSAVSSQPPTQSQGMSAVHRQLVQPPLLLPPPPPLLHVPLQVRSTKVVNSNKQQQQQQGQRTLPAAPPLIDVRVSKTAVMTSDSVVPASATITNTTSTVVAAEKESATGDLNGIPEPCQQLLQHVPPQLLEGLPPLTPQQLHNHLMLLHQLNVAQQQLQKQHQQRQQQQQQQQQPPALQTSEEVLPQSPQTQGALQKPVVSPQVQQNPNVKTEQTLAQISASKPPDQSKGKSTHRSSQSRRRSLQGKSAKTTSAAKKEGQAKLLPTLQQQLKQAIERTASPQEPDQEVQQLQEVSCDQKAASALVNTVNSQHQQQQHQQQDSQSVNQHEMVGVSNIPSTTESNDCHQQKQQQNQQMSEEHRQLTQKQQQLEQQLLELQQRIAASQQEQLNNCQTPSCEVRESFSLAKCSSSSSPRSASTLPSPHPLHPPASSSPHSSTPSPHNMITSPSPSQSNSSSQDHHALLPPPYPDLSHNSCSSSEGLIAKREPLSQPESPVTRADESPLATEIANQNQAKPSDSTKRIIQALTEKLKRNQLQRAASESDSRVSFTDINDLIKESIGDRENSCDNLMMEEETSVDYVSIARTLNNSPKPACSSSGKISPISWPQCVLQSSDMLSFNNVTSQSSKVTQSTTLAPSSQPPASPFKTLLPSTSPHPVNKSQPSPGGFDQPSPSNPRHASPSSFSQLSPGAFYQDLYGGFGAITSAQLPSALRDTPSPGTSGSGDREPEGGATPLIIQPRGQEAFLPQPPLTPAQTPTSGYGDLKSPDSGFNESCVSPSDTNALSDVPPLLAMGSDASRERIGKRRRSSASSVCKGISSCSSSCSSSSKSTSPAIIIPKIENDESGYSYFIETSISTSQRLDEDKMTYLNKGQFYGMSLEFQPKLPRLQRPRTVKSVIMLVFREEKTLADEMKAWEFWHSRQHSIKQRILDIDTKNSAGIVPNSIDEVAHNAVAVKWTPTEQPAKVSIAINCLSTDFSNQKGVKGLPLHVQIDTFEDSRDPLPSHRAYCQVKIFCDKGAERKTRDEERRKEAKSKGCQDSSEPSSTSGGSGRTELFHPPAERSRFYTMADLKAKPGLFIPQAAYEDKYPLGDTYGESPLYNHKCDTALTPVKRMRIDSLTREPERVLLYVRELQEHVYTALLLQIPTLPSLAAAVEEKYGIPADKIHNIYKRSIKGILVKMDDNIIRHYSNESTFIIAITKNEQTRDSPSYDVTLTEIDSDTH